MYNIRAKTGILATLLIVVLSDLPVYTGGTQAQVSAGPSINPELMGMAIRDPWYDFGTLPGQPNSPNTAAQDAMGANLAHLGVRWVRLEFQIEDLMEGSDAYSLTQVARNDYFINTVAPRHGLKVLGLLGFGLIRGYDPRTLLLTDTLRLDPVYGGGVNDRIRMWLDRARMIANRYEGRVHGYEVLNEQNRLPGNGQPGVGGDSIPAAVTARMHTKFYRFFSQLDARPDQQWRKDTKIIVGGLHPAGTGTPGKAGYISDRDYLKQLYQSDGFQSFYLANGHYPLDGIGYHPYPEEIRISLQSDLDMIGARMDAVREVLSQVQPNPGNPPFWVTEIGYNSAYAAHTRHGQAEFMHSVYTTLGARSDVATIFWFKYEDFPPDSGRHAQRWGVVHIPFTMSDACPGSACYDPLGMAKPTSSFLVYRRLAGLPVHDVWLPIGRK